MMLQKRGLMGGGGGGVVNPYQTADKALVVHWDAIWNGGLGVTDQQQRMVDLCGHCGELEVKAGTGTAVFGESLLFDGTLDFQCLDNSYINSIVASGITQTTDDDILSSYMLSDLDGTTNNGDYVEITNWGDNGVFKCFLMRSRAYRNYKYMISDACICAKQTNVTYLITGATNYASDAIGRQKRMSCASGEFTTDGGINMSSYADSELAGRLPTEPSLVSRFITGANIRSFKGSAGAKFYRLLIYNRSLSDAEYASIVHAADVRRGFTFF